MIVVRLALGFDVAHLAEVVQGPDDGLLRAPDAEQRVHADRPGDLKTTNRVVNRNEYSLKLLHLR
jgi:hypothetical protein